MSGAGPPVRVKRPSSLVGGVVLMGVRVITGLSVILTVILSWQTYAATIVLNGQRIGRVDLQTAGLVLAIVLAAYGLFLVLYLGMALLVWRGHNWARVVAMSFASLSILFSFADYSLNGAQITLRTSLVSVTIDILILLALSSANARHYARSVRATRSAR